MRVALKLSPDYPNPQMWALKGRVLLTKADALDVDVDEAELRSLVSNPHVMLEYTQERIGKADGVERTGIAVPADGIERTIRTDDAGHFYVTDPETGVEFESGEGHPEHHTAADMLACLPSADLIAKAHEAGVECGDDFGGLDGGSLAAAKWALAERIALAKPAREAAPHDAPEPSAPVKRPRRKTTARK
jgi:hypothetical protein